MVQRALTVTADAQSRTYGNSNPALTYTLGGLGLVNGETLSGGLATVADSTSAAGLYAITQGTLRASANHTLSYQGALLTVTGAPAPRVPAFDATRLASTVVQSLGETGVLPFGAEGLPLRDLDPPPGATGQTPGFAGLTDPRFQGIVVCMGSTAGACFPVPFSAPPPSPGRQAAL